MDHDPNTDHSQPATTSPPPFGGYQEPLPLSQIALWSMIVGIVGLCLGPLGLIALILGIIGITQTTGDNARPGLGFAIAGTVLGPLALITTCLSIGILLPAIGSARMTAKTILSQSQLRQIQIGMEGYRFDFGKYPPADDWQATLSDCLAGTPTDPIFTSPLSDGDAVEFVYVPGDFVNDPTLIMFYEDPDHLGYQGEINVAYAGGGVTSIPVEELEQELADRGYTLQWE